MNIIRLLDPTLINQIAAGEVIERPASAIKELVENAIDAEATQIDVTIRDGGRTAMIVQDNGGGMSRTDLELAIERHATSKIPDNNLFDIKSLGFRGEALPSIASVSRLCIATRHESEAHAWQLSIEGGFKAQTAPASLPNGTRVEVRDLFFATPARLKFLKSSTTELNQIKDILQRLALAYPQIRFSLTDGERKLFQLNAAEKRLAEVMGSEFVANACEVRANYDDLMLQGHISVPTFNRGNAQEQYFFVNGRPVKDKLLATAMRVAYQDFLAYDRHPSSVLFLSIPPEDLDINVHPTKAEVRFRDTQQVRGFVINALRETLQSQGGRTSTTIATQMLTALRPSPAPVSYQPRMTFPTSTAPARALEETPISMPAPAPIETPLGYARAQIHNTYIIAEAAEKLILVDQHAAHERLVYERLKEQMNTQGVQRQALLIPEVINLSVAEIDVLTNHLETLNQYGLILETFGGETVIVREIPALLGKVDVKQLVLDIVHELQETDAPHLLKEHLHEILASHGCHHSIRAGRQLTLDEMNALLRQMEQTPHSGQCNHGRPTYVVLERRDIEKLFGRR